MRINILEEASYASLSASDYPGPGVYYNLDTNQLITVWENVVQFHYVNHPFPEMIRAGVTMGAFDGC